MSGIQNSVEDGIKKDNEALRTTTYDRRYVKSLEHMFYDTVDGVNYYAVYRNGTVRQQLPTVKKIKLRSDDVIMCGYPKSGCHWIFEVISMILQQNTEFNKRSFHLNMLEFLNVEVQVVLDAIESPRCLSTHLRCYRLPDHVVEKRLKLVYLLRNPKDIAVSLYHMFASNGPDFSRYNGTFREFFDLYLRGEFFWGYWFDHVRSVEEYMNEHPECEVFILSYEKMKETPAEAIRDLCIFLGKPDVLAEDIARATEFANMKTELMNGKMKLIKQMACQPDKDYIFRKGEIGDWKNWIAADQNEAFDQLFKEKMANSKLAHFVRKYIL